MQPCLYGSGYKTKFNFVIPALPVRQAGCPESKKDKFY